MQSDQTKDISVHGVGNALVDLQVRVDDAFLDSMGLTKGQMMLVDEGVQVDVLRAVASRSGVHRCSGGSAANTVVGVAALGGRASFLGKVAKDELGHFYMDDLHAAGVLATGLPGDGLTGSVVVLITPDAQRTMLTHLGASSDLGPEDVDAARVAGSRFLYVEGYLLTGERTRAAALRAIDLAVAAGVPVAFTVSDPFVIERHGDLIWELVRGPVDLLFCNEMEARSLTGLDNPIDCAQLVHRHARNVALTLGPAGSILMHENEVIPIEGVPVAAVDTTGAGDMYAAGILHGIAAGLDWKTAGRLASHAAARVVAQLGARLPRPFTESELAALTRPS